MAAHAEYGASSMERWTSCLGSPRLCVGLPSYDTEWSEDGTTAHGLMQHCLLWRERDATAFVGVIVEPVQGEKFGPITDDHARNVQVLLDYVYDILDRYPDAQLSVEHRVHIPSSAVPDQMWGTTDVKIYVPSIVWLFIIDYKHGVGISVDIHDNKQLKFYGLGALWEHMLLGQAVAGVTLAVVQPRSYSTQGGIKDQDVTTAELLAFHGYVEEKAYATLDPYAPLVPNPDYCRWCPAAGHGRCPALARTALATVGTELNKLTKADLPDPQHMSFEQMIAVLDAWPLLNGWKKVVYETAIGFARKGGHFPGRKMVFTGARREWHGEPGSVAVQLAVLAGCSVDEVYGRQLVGITEAENRIVDAFRHGLHQLPDETKKAFTVRQNEASRLAREAMAMLTLKKPSGSFELVPISDPRPAIDGAATFFAGRVNMEGL